MARVTVEDCVLQIPNRFELVMLAAHRARALGSGAELKVERDRDKNPVVALREIADQKLDLKNVEEALVKSLQRRIEPDRPEEEDEAAEIMSSEQQSWINDMGSSEEDDDLEDSDMDEEAEASEESEASFDSGSFEDAVIKD